MSPASLTANDDAPPGLDLVEGFRLHVCACTRNKLAESSEPTRSFGRNISEPMGPCLCRGGVTRITTKENERKAKGSHCFVCAEKHTYRAARHVVSK